MAAEIEVANLVTRIRIEASGIEAGISAAKQALKGLDTSYDANAAASKRAAQEAANAYRQASIDAQALAQRAKSAGAEEADALKKSADAASKKAGLLGIAAEQAKLDYDKMAQAAQAAATDEQRAGEAAQQAAQAVQQAAAGQSLAQGAMAAAASKAFATIVGAVRGGIAAYNESVVLHRKLTQVMENTMGARAGEVRGVEQLIAAQRDLGVVNKAAQTAGAQELGTYLTKTETLKKLLPVMNDMVAQQLGVGASAESVANIATMLGKVMDGQVGALSRYGYSFTEAQEAILKTGTEMERAAVLADVVEASVGGMNEALGKTDAGALDRMAEAAGDLQEGLGAAMAPAVQIVAELWGGFLGIVRDFVQENPALVAGLVTTAGALTGLLALKKAADMIGTAKTALAALGLAAKATGANVAAAGVQAGAGIAAGAGTAGAAISAAMPWVLALSLVVGGVVALATAIKKQEEADAQARQERQESIVQLGTQRDEIRSLGAEYAALSSQSTKSIGDKQRISEIEAVLAEKYGITAAALRDYTAAMQENAGSAGDLAAEHAKLAYDQSVDALKAEMAATLELTDGYKGLVQEIEEAKNAKDGAELTLSLAAEDDFDVITPMMNAIQEADATLADGEARLAQMIAEALRANVDAGMSAVVNGVQAKAPELAGAFGGVIAEVYRAALQDDAATQELGIDFTTKFVDDITAALGDIDLSGALDKVQKDLAEFGRFDALDESDQQAYKERLHDFSQEVAAMAQTAVERMGLTGEAAETMKTQLVSSMRASADAYVGVATAAANAAKAAQETAKADTLQGAREGYAAAQEGARGLLETTLKQRQALDDNLAALQVLQDAENHSAEQKKAAQEQLRKAYGEGAAQDIEWTQFQIEQDAALNDQRLASAEGLLQARQAVLQAEYDTLNTQMAQSENDDERAAIQLRINEIYAEILENSRAMQGLRVDIDGMSDAERQAAQTSGALQKMEAAVKSLGQKREANKNLAELATAAKASGQSLQQADARLRAYAAGTGITEKGIDGVIDALEREGATMGAETSAMSASLESMLAGYIETKTAIEAGAQGRFSADGSDLLNEADVAIVALTALLALLGAAGGTTKTERKGGGGGGKSKKAQAEEEARREAERAAEEARRAAEEARRAQEEAWQRELDDQLKYLERKKRLNEISTQEEIRQLERIMREYARTTEQKIDMEDRIFEARARLRDQEIAEIDKLNDGVISALRARYEEQRRIEEDRLSAAADSWRAWADESVKAIQAQIAALDELTKTEDRAEQEAAKLRKIEATRQMLAYTTDEANREQLAKDLTRQQEELAKWQRQNAIADEKERLRAEQEAMRERAQTEQDAIAKQQEQLAAIYDERLKDAALRAEAERTLTQHSQQDILQLIADYAPDYEATGATLGERMYKGLTGALGSITDWFANLNKQISAVESQAAKAALSAADAFYKAQQQGGTASAGVSAAPATVTVEPTYNFYAPVESPAEIARKVQQANEDLAGLLV